MTRWLGYALGTVLMLSMLLAAPVAAADPSYTYTFATHAAFFSHETNQPAVIDPQVFVADPAVAAATGPQNILHRGGYRPARATSDAPSVSLFTAQGIPLGFTLGEWLGAKRIGQAQQHRALLRPRLLFLGLQRPPVCGGTAGVQRVALTYAATMIVALAAHRAGRPDLIRSPEQVLAHLWEGDE